MKEAEEAAAARIIYEKEEAERLEALRELERVQIQLETALAEARRIEGELKLAEL